MNNEEGSAPRPIRQTSAAALLCGASPAAAQKRRRLRRLDPSGAATTPQLARRGHRVASAPNPYYLGASQAFTHDTNVYRIADRARATTTRARACSAASTSASAGNGFSATATSPQPLLQTRRSSTTSATASPPGSTGKRSRTSPATSTSACNRNLARPRRPARRGDAAQQHRHHAKASTRARAGAALRCSRSKARLGYSNIDYSAPESVTSESRQDSGGLALYYRPGGLLRLGIGGRVSAHAHAEGALRSGHGDVPVATPSTARNLDLLADYELSGLLSFNGRLSYTDQTNSGIGSADFLRR